MTELFAFGTDDTVVNMRHVRRIVAKWFEDEKYSVIAEIDSTMWTVLAGPFNTKEQANLAVEWIGTRLGALPANWPT